MGLCVSESLQPKHKQPYGATLCNPSLICREDNAQNEIIPQPKRAETSRSTVVESLGSIWE